MKKRQREIQLKISAGLFLLIFFLVITPFAEAQIKKSDKGYRYFQQNRYERAIDHFNDAIPNGNELYQADGLFLQSYSHLKLAGLYLIAVESASNVALDYYQMMLDSPQLKKIAYVDYFYGLSCLGLEAYEDALQAFSSSSSLEGYGNLSQLWKGYALYQSGKKQDANSLFSAVESGGNDSEKSELLLIYLLLNKDTEKVKNLAAALNTGKSDNRMKKNLAVIYAELGDVENAEKWYNAADWEMSDATDRSDALRVIRFYDIVDYRRLSRYHFNMAKNRLLNLRGYNSKKYNGIVTEFLGEVYFYLGYYDRSIKECESRSKSQKCMLFGALSTWMKGDIDKAQKIWAPIKKSSVLGEKGYLISLYKINRNKGVEYCQDAFHDDPDAESGFWLGYVLYNVDQKTVAESIMDKTYTRSNIYNFSKNTPRNVLFYSMIMYLESPGVNCPESTQMAERLSAYYTGFGQYLNYMQGICASIYSAEGDSQIDH